MLFAIIFVIAFIVIAGFALYLSRTIEHGEARFDDSGRVISDQSASTDVPSPAPSEPAKTHETGEEQ